MVSGRNAWFLPDFNFYFYGFMITPWNPNEYTLHNCAHWVCGICLKWDSENWVTENCCWSFVLKKIHHVDEKIFHLIKSLARHWNFQWIFNCLYLFDQDVSEKMLNCVCEEWNNRSIYMQVRVWKLFSANSILFVNIWNKLLKNHIECLSKLTVSMLLLVRRFLNGDFYLKNVNSTPKVRRLRSRGWR